MINKLSELTRGTPIVINRELRIKNLAGESSEQVIPAGTPGVFLILEGEVPIEGENIKSSMVRIKLDPPLGNLKILSVDINNIDRIE